MSSSPDQINKSQSSNSSQAIESNNTGVNQASGTRERLRKEWKEWVDKMDISPLPPFVKGITVRLLYLTWKLYGAKLIAVGGGGLILLGSIGFIVIPVPRPLTTEKVVITNNQSNSLVSFFEKDGIGNKCKGDYCQIQILRLCKADTPLILKIKDNNSTPSTGTFLFALALNDGGKFKTTDLTESEDVNLRDYYQAKPGTFNFMMDKLSGLDNGDKILFFINSSPEFNGKYEFNFDCNDQNLTNLGLMKSQIMQFFKQLFSAK